MAIKISGNTVIDDSRNITSSGTMSASAYIGDGSQLTNLPGGGNTLPATASGTLADGSKVIVNADGTVSVVAKTETTGAGVYSASKTVFESDEPYQTQSAFVGSGKIVIVYRADTGSGSHGHAVVGTVSGTSISFGTPVVFNTANTVDLSVTYDSANDKVVVAYSDYGNNGYGTALVGEVSGTSISFPSSPVVFESHSSQTNHIASTFDPVNNKVVIVYRAGSPYRGYGIVGTVSGTSISFGTPAVYSSNRAEYPSATFDSTNNKVVIAYSDHGDSYYGKAVVGTVSGTSISFGSPVVWSSTGNTGTAKSVVYDSSSQKVVIVYRDNDGSLYYTRAIVGTVSGTSISFGTAVVVSATNSTEIRATYDSTNNKVAVTYLNGSGLFAVVGTVSETTISFGSAIEIESVYSTYGFPVYDSTNDKVVVAYGDSASSNRGTAIVLATTGFSITQLGSASIFESATTNELSIVYDSYNDRMVMAYRDDGNSGYGTAVVGTVSGTSITFGTPVVFNSGSTYYTSMAFDSTNNKVVISYADYGAGGAGKAIVGTVSGTSISFGTEATITSSNINANTTVYDPDSEGGKILVFYRNADSSGYGMGQVGTVSGTSISFASAVTFESASINGPDAVYTTGGKTVIVYQDNGNSDYGTAVVATINPSGGALTFGTPVVFHSGAIGNLAAKITYDSDNDKVVIIHNITEGGSYTDAYAVIGTVSGTLSSATISFGTSVVFETLDAAYGNSDIVYDSDSQKIVIAYRYQSSPENGKIVVGSVSGTSISFESSLFFREGATVNGPPVVGYDSTNKKVVVAYRDIGNSSYGTAKVFSPITKATNLTAENFIGISDASYTNGQTATIQLAGSVDDAQSGLTPGQKYYVQGDGTLSETADSPSVFAGTAVATTKLIVKN